MKMGLELLLLCSGTLATGITVLAAFIYMRSQKRAGIDPEMATEGTDEATSIRRPETSINETKIDIKIVGAHITLTARDMDVETLERLIETLTARQVEAKSIRSVSEQRIMEGQREADTA